MKVDGVFARNDVGDGGACCGGFFGRGFRFGRHLCFFLLRRDGWVSRCEMSTRGCGNVVLTLLATVWCFWGVAVDVDGVEICRFECCEVGFLCGFAYDRACWYVT